MEGVKKETAGTPFVTGDRELARRLMEIGVPVTPRTVRSWRYAKRIPCGKVRGTIIYRWSEVEKTLEGWTGGDRPAGASSRRVRVL